MWKIYLDLLNDLVIFLISPNLYVMIWLSVYFGQNKSHSSRDLIKRKLKSFQVMKPFCHDYYYVFQEKTVTHILFFRPLGQR